MERILIQRTIKTWRGVLYEVRPRSYHEAGLFFYKTPEQRDPEQAEPKSGDQDRIRDPVYEGGLYPRPKSHRSGPLVGEAWRDDRLHRREGP